MKKFILESDVRLGLSKEQLAEGSAKIQEVVYSTDPRHLFLCLQPGLHLKEIEVPDPECPTCGKKGDGSDRYVKPATRPDELHKCLVCGLKWGAEVKADTATAEAPDGFGRTSRVVTVNGAQVEIKLADGSGERELQQLLTFICAERWGAGTLERIGETEWRWRQAAAGRKDAEPRHPMDRSK